jgi:hypothetical protein
VGSVNELDTWIAAACVELGLHPDDIKAKSVLDVARDVAHQVIRPGAPVSAYLMGVAVGRGADPSDVAARLSALALSWPKENAELPKENAELPKENAELPKENAELPKEKAEPPKENAELPKGTREDELTRARKAGRRAEPTR